jgi:hypothetical protein
LLPRRPTGAPQPSWDAARESSPPPGIASSHAEAAFSLITVRSLPRLAPYPTSASRAPGSADGLEKSLAAGISLLIFLPLRFHVAIWTMGALITIIALPVVARVMNQYRALRLWISLSMVLGVAGVVLFLFNTPLAWSKETQRYVFIIPWLCICTLGLAWCSTKIRPERTMALAGLSGVLAGLWVPNAPGNDWKYNIGLPCSIAIMALAVGSLWKSIGSVILVTTISYLTDTRSLAFLALIAGLAELLSRRRPISRSTLKRLSLVVLVAALSAYLVVRASLGGWLGLGVQAKAEGQSPDHTVLGLLLGARPEAQGNFVNIVTHPLSTYFGSPPPYEFAARLENSFAVRNLDPKSAYVQGFVLSPNGLELHSIMADLWYFFGIFGLCLAAMLAFAYLRAIRIPTSIHGMTTLNTFCSVTALFYLFLGPLSDLRYAPIALTLGLAQNGSFRPSSHIALGQST